MSKEEKYEELFFENKRLKFEINELLYRIAEVKDLLEAKIESSNKTKISSNVTHTDYTMLTSEVNAWNDVLEILKNIDL